MPATIHPIPPASLAYDWPLLARRIDAHLRDWLAIVNTRYPQQSIAVLKAPADDADFCGWTLSIANPYEALIAQVIAGGPLCPQLDRRCRLDVWLGKATDHDPLAPGLGVHGGITTTFLGNAQTPLPLTSELFPSTANMLASSSNDFRHLQDVFVAVCTTPGGEFFAAGQSDHSAFPSADRLFFLLSREMATNQWILLSFGVTGCTLIAGRAEPPGFRFLARVSSNHLWVLRSTGDYCWPAVLNTATYQWYQGPVILEKALILPSDIVAVTNQKALTIGQASGRPPDEFFCSIGAGLAVSFQLP